MQAKYLAVAIAAIGSTSAFAAKLDPITTTPAVTFVISGASAQKNAVANSVPSTLFATPADVVQINGSRTAAPDLLGNTSTIKSQAWLGMSVAAQTGGTSVPLLVIYNSTNGSAAGLTQLISTTATEAEAYNVALPCASAATAANLATPDGTLTMTAYTCNSLAQIETDIALSDVQPGEFAAGLLPTTGNSYTTVTTGLEGFGVIVNAALYNDLQAQNVADGLLPSSCLNNNTDLSCQPSIRAADYAKLANNSARLSNKAATLLPATGVVGTHGDGSIKLCRRDNYSGTQAASNIFFLNNVCGNAGYGGSLAPTGDYSNATNKFSSISAANIGTSQAESCVSGSTGYGIGVVGLGEAEGSSATDGSRSYRYVKIDGVSPNVVTTAGATSLSFATDAMRRANIINGSYTFATEMSAAYSATDSASASYLISNALINELKKATQSNLAGIAYEDGTWAYKDATSYSSTVQQTRYKRGGNNCGALR